jgi:hypothetical protein
MLFPSSSVFVNIGYLLVNHRGKLHGILYVREAIGYLSRRNDNGSVVKDSTHDALADAYSFATAQYQIQ